MRQNFVTIGFLLLITASLLRYCSSLQIGETCSSNNNQCDAGLRCQTCAANGNTRPRCACIQPLSSVSKVKDLPRPVRSEIRDGISHHSNNEPKACIVLLFIISATSTSTSDAFMCARILIRSSIKLLEQNGYNKAAVGGSVS
ncbi:uncharacterized protein LOC124919353 [Impatiens glandulifera]|uniref:uncharacterized protein LOC124919353 n=1 Tax=Impatiens glandulifera TaxID=253017 RepID=UPI001FB1834E|nr:uncharacterized protein LOC124919353 [Impatiens glandulifera]